MVAFQRIVRSLHQSRHRGLKIMYAYPELWVLEEKVDQECDYKITFLSNNFEEFIKGLVNEEIFAEE